jgi:hypothetical protein
VDSSKTFEERFEAHVAAMAQATEGNYNWRVINMLTGLVHFYEFVHAKKWLSDALEADKDTVAVVGLGRGAHVTSAVRLRRTQTMQRSHELATDIIRAIGTAREQTYIHDLVYGLHRTFDVALHALHAGMQGCEHVNKQMKLILTSQCTAAVNNRRGKEGERMVGDVAQAAVAIVAKQHIISGPRAEGLPTNLYSQRMQGLCTWNSKSSVDRVQKRDHKVFSAGSSSGLNALRDGTHSPKPRTVLASPEPMAQLLSDPSRKKRLVTRLPSRLRPDANEPEPPCARK